MQIFATDIQLNCGWIGSRELCETESIMSDTIVRITDWSHSCKYDVTSPDWDTAVDGVAVGPDPVAAHLVARRERQIEVGVHEDHTRAALLRTSITKANLRHVSRLNFHEVEAEFGAHRPNDLASRIRWLVARVSQAKDDFIKLFDHRLRPKFAELSAPR